MFPVLLIQSVPVSPFLQPYILPQLPSHPPPCWFPHPCKLNFPPFNLPTLFLSHLVTFTCWGPYFTPLYLDKTGFPPYYWGTRKRRWTGELFSIPFSLPAAASSSAHRSSRHRRCFPTRHRLRCSARVECAREDIARAGRWPVRKVFSGHLNSKKTCKYLLQICAKCRFHVAYNLIKPGEIFTGMKKSHLW